MSALHNKCAHIIITGCVDRISYKRSEATGTLSLYRLATDFEMGTSATTSLLLLSLLVAGAVAWPWHNTYQAMVMESAARTTSTIGLPSTVITKGLEGFKCDSISAKIKNYDRDAVVYLCQTGS